MSIKRKLYIVIPVCALCLILLTGSVVSYFTTKDSKTNVFVVTDNTIEIIEDFETPTNKTGDVKKIVQIKNTGLTSCYIRVSANFDKNLSDDAYVVDWNTDKWMYNELDNYYYYINAVSPNNITTPLCTKVTIKEDVENLSDFNLLIYAESIQAGTAQNYIDAWADFGIDLSK